MKKTAKKSKFQTPHEKKVTAKAAQSKKIGPTPKVSKKPKVNGAVKALRDAFGGLIGSRCSNINLAVIEAGTKGATAKEIAGQIGEDASLVSAQLCWMFKPKGFLSRDKEGRTFRYFVKAR